MKISNSIKQSEQKKILLVEFRHAAIPVLGKRPTAAGTKDATTGIRNGANYSLCGQHRVQHIKKIRVRHTVCST